jgi:hypothetical protein
MLRRKTPAPARAPGRPPVPDEQSRVYRGKEKFTGIEIRRALEVNYGNPTMAAASLVEAEKSIGGSRTISIDAIRLYMDKRPQLAAKIGKVKTRGLIELAEGNVARRVAAGDGVMSRWVLDRIGSDYGWKPPEMQIVLDPSQLSVDQLLELLDPARMTDEQIDALLQRMAERYDRRLPKEPEGTVVDHEAVALPRPE